MQKVGFKEENKVFLEQIKFLSNFTDDNIKSFNLVLPGDLITSEPGFIQLIEFNLGGVELMRTKVPSIRV